jgi:hypothetical protein
VRVKGKSERGDPFTFTPTFTLRSKGEKVG